MIPMFVCFPDCSVSLTSLTKCYWNVLEQLQRMNGLNCNLWQECWQKGRLNFQRQAGAWKKLCWRTLCTCLLPLVWMGRSWPFELCQFPTFHPMFSNWVIWGSRLLQDWLQLSLMYYSHMPVFRSVLMKNDWTVPNEHCRWTVKTLKIPPSEQVIEVGAALVRFF